MTNKDNRVTLALEPGPKEISYAVIRPTDRKPIEVGKVPNKSMAAWIKGHEHLPFNIGSIVIRIPAATGLHTTPITINTLIWAGRLIQIATDQKFPVEFITLNDIRRGICGTSMGITQTQIKRVLQERYAINETNETDQWDRWFKGFKEDIWLAYAAGIVYLDHKEAPSLVADEPEDPA